MPAAVRPVQAPVAFHYEAFFPEPELRWYTRFETLVTGAVLEASQRRALREGGVGKLLAYEWTSGFYPGDPVSASLDWQSRVRARREQWLLTETPVGGAAAERGPAEWYDFANDDLVDARARHLAGLLDSSGYDGFFFDTPGVQALPRVVANAWQVRNPRLDYTEQVGRFLRHLRARIGDKRIIFTNQGYRQADQLLPAANFDLSESYFTYVKPGDGTGFRPWHDPDKPWESIFTPVDQLISPALAKFPNVKMVHVNYAGGATSMKNRALRYSWACARIFGHEAYLMCPDDPYSERDEIYFADLGEAEGPWEQNPARTIVWRRFQRAVVAINSSPEPARVPGLDLPLPQPFQGYVFPSGAR